MKFSDNGIIISQKKYSENSAIIKVFSKENGIYSGFVSNLKSKKNQAIFQIGNLISFEWRARSEDGLGHFYYVDLVKSFTAKIIFDRLKLSCCSSLFSIIDSCFLERENHCNLFTKIYNFLLKISDENISKNVFLTDYISLELKILEVLGYGIDLSSCVVTNATTNLTFVSPKSARAVSFEAGKRYENLLLKLPQFLLTQYHSQDLVSADLANHIPANDEDNLQNYQEIKDSHLQDGLRLSGYFLEKYIFAEKNIRPASRLNIERALNVL